MTWKWGESRAALLVGDARDSLRRLDDASVHCCVTSPPYWGLRAYAGDQTGIWGGEAGCVHEWGALGPPFHPGQVEQTKWKNADGAGNAGNTASGCFCQLCGAWRGSLGLEPTPDLYVSHLLEILDTGLRRVLRADGTLWVNLGDSYASGNRKWRAPDPKDGKGGRTMLERGLRPDDPTGVKPKDLVGIPWRVAFAMRDRGWYLRSAIPWVKRNAMPSSVRDRPTTGTEYIFLFAHPDSRGRYYYDIEGVKVASTGMQAGNRKRKTRKDEGHGRVTDGPSALGSSVPVQAQSIRNRRDTDWFFASLDAICNHKAQGLLHNEDGEPVAMVVNPRPFKAAHFAVFPPGMARPAVLAGTSERGVCCQCGKPWLRVVGRATRPGTGQLAPPREQDGGLTVQHGVDRTGMSHFKADEWAKENPPRTLGWRPACDCDGLPTWPKIPRKPRDPDDAALARWEAAANNAKAVQATILQDAKSITTDPAVTLDPFGGAGTTALVSLKAGRRSVYIDASREYRQMAAARLRKAAPTTAPPSPAALATAKPAAVTPTTEKKRATENQSAQISLTLWTPSATS